MLSLLLQGWRSWKSAKAVALLAATALTIGIGSATAIYTMVEAVLLKPLPWTHGERFVSLFGADVRDPVHVSSSSWPDLLEYKERTRSFDAFGAYRLREFSLTAPGEPQHLGGVEVSPSFVNSLGVNPLIGRWFGNGANGNAASESENVRLAVISGGLWKRLGRDPGIVGTTLTLDRRLYTVSGVMPEWFRLPLATTDGGEFRSDIWVPLEPPLGNTPREELPFDLFCYARLKPGVTMAQADADVKRVAAELAKEFPKEHPSYTAVVINLLDVIVRDVRPALLLLFGAAGALLLITCANVAGLMLARAVVRARDTAIRVALGATSGQLARQYLVEGFLISVAGAAGGILVSLALVRFVLSVVADYLPRSDGIGVNWTALVFVLGAAVVSSMLLSLAPLWQALRTLPNEALRDDVHASAGSRSRSLSRSLVVAEIALAFTLLASSALILAHFGNLLRVPSGFDPSHLATFRLNFNEADYPGDMKLRAPYQKRLLQATEQIPGVSHAAFANQLPIEGCCYTTTLTAEGRPDIPNADLSVSYVVISSSYFQTMRIPLLNGRLFDGVHDLEGDTLSMVIDQATAKRYWPDRDPIGALGQLGTNGGRVRVIGIVGNVRNRGFREEGMPEVYLPGTILSWNPMRFIVRTSLPAATLIPQLRRAVRSVDPAQPIYAVKTMDEIIQGSLVSERLEAFLTMFFALTALLMAALGIYGVVSYSVRHRTVEIGTRMALGAQSRDVLRLVIGEGLTMAAYGIGIGGVAVFGVARLLSAKVFGILIDDARPFVYSTGIIVGSTALAAFFPGWRATLVSPMVAIRRDSGATWQDIQRGARAFAARMSCMVSGADDAMALAEGPLLAKFAESSRRADSFRQAIAFALATVRETINCESAWLLEKHSGSEYRCDDYAMPANGLLIGRLTHYPFPLPLNRGDFDAWSQWATIENAEHTTEISYLRESGARLAVPLLARSEIAGVLMLGAPIGRGEFSGTEKRLLQQCATQFALMIENARLTERIVEQEKLQRDLHLAVEVQKRLLPDKPPATATVALAGMSLPARSIGGDYYDFLDLGDHRVGIALADVAGKGIPAALIMSVVQASLRILATEEGVSLSNLAARMNHFLHRATGSGSSAYATFFYAQIDERRRQLRYVNAGHNPPYLLRYAARSERVVEELPAGGTVIGLFPQTSYEEATLDLEPGDVLMAFTDGVLEALNPKDEEFGEERLRDLLCRWAHLGVDGMASHIAGELKSWIAGAAQYDDLTFILVKVNQQP